MSPDTRKARHPVAEAWRLIETGADHLAQECIMRWMMETLLLSEGIVVVEIRVTWPDVEDSIFP